MSGNALHKLFDFIHPYVRHVVTASFEEDSALDLEGDTVADDPVMHLRRQAFRIRRGDRVDRITVLLPEKVAT
jgi:hypothetical protein